MKNFFSSLLSNEKGSLSSTRFVGVFGFLFLVITLIVTSFNNIKPSEILIETIGNIVMVALFVNSGTNVAALIKQSKNTAEK